MADSGTLKRRLGWLEWGLYLGGVALVVVYFMIRSEGERLRQEGLQAFEQNAVQTAGPGEGGDELPTELPGEATSGQNEVEVLRAPSPNQDQWAEKRIHEFRESLNQAGDPPLAVLRIDHLGIQVPVFNGTDEFNLNRGVGRIKGTARIDTEGNLGIAGHRDGFFRPLKDIEVGDSMTLQTTGGTVTYEVLSIEIVEPDDVSVLSPTRERTITLVTCYPFYYVGHAPKRFIVKATAEHFLAKT